MRPFAIVVLVLNLTISACNNAPPPSSSNSNQPVSNARFAAGVAPAEASPDAAQLALQRAPGEQAQAASATRAPLTFQTTSPHAAAVFDEVTLVTGTRLSVELESAVGSDSSRVEDPVQGRLAMPVRVNGVTALAAGSRLDGVVTAAVISGRVKGRAHLAFTFDRLTGPGESERYSVTTSVVSRTAATTRRKDAAKVGGGALGGAIIGGLIGGKKGAALGTAVGAGGGTAVVMGTRGDEVRLSRGTVVTVRLMKPVVVRVRHE